LVILVSSGLRGVSLKSNIGVFLYMSEEVTSQGCSDCHYLFACKK